MTSAEAASILAVLHGAYPNTRLDDAVSHVWENSLLTADFATARQAASEWVAREKWWPTVAEFNGNMRHIREVNNPPALPPTTRIADMQQAQAAFSEGYRRSRHKLGDNDEQIQEKLDVLLRRWPGAIVGVS